MNIHEQMRTGEVYCEIGEDELTAQRVACQTQLYDYNLSRPTEPEKRTAMLRALLGSAGEGVFIEPPFKCAYGSNIHIGERFYANFNLVIVDDVEVYIGDNVMFGPNVTISVTGHPIHAEARCHGEQFSRPIYIEDGVWIGSNTVVLPGVRIGRGSVIGAGSVVSRDIPPGAVAVGAPCRAIREITDADRQAPPKGK